MSIEDTITDTIIWLEGKLNNEDVLWEKGKREISEKLLEHLKEYQNSKRTLEEIEKEKKLRPFKNVIEFFKVTKSEINEVIRYRQKKNAQQVVIMINGYTNDELVIFGGTYHSLTNLFEYYEYYDNDNTQWRPFGVEEDEA